MGKPIFELYPFQVESLCGVWSRALSGKLANLDHLEKSVFGTSGSGKSSYAKRRKVCG